MIKIWSELPVARMKEQLADLATLVWVVFWGNLVWQLFQFLIGFTEAGRAVHAGGENMIEGGRSLGGSLAGLPLVGSQVRDIASAAFAAGGQPISAFGTELEQFITVVSVVLALLLALVTIGPWLIRYIPWRLGAASPGPVRPSRDPDSAGHRRRCPGNARDAGDRAPGLFDPARLHAGPDRRLVLRAPRPTRAGGARQRGAQTGVAGARRALSTMRPGLQTLQVPGTGFLFLHAARPIEIRPTEEILERDPVRGEQDASQEDEDRREDQEGNDREFHSCHQLSLCR